MTAPSGRYSLLALLLALVGSPLWADVGDPQLKTDHPWYPGELACSTFERLFATQAAVYTRVTGREVKTDEDKALAAWLWRNTHYWHGEEGACDLWAKGFSAGGDLRNREYWTGLFAHGSGLCGTTHSQWTTEFEHLFGHGRARGVGVDGHNSLEVFLTGGEYGEGRWAILDHDLSTVIFSRDGGRLLSLKEVAADWKQLTRRDYLPGKQHGWLVCGLHEGDGGSYAKYGVAEYLAGYSGPPPLVHLRRGESLRRYYEPGLEDGKTFVFWGRNYNPGGIPGPERSHTWVNQPEKMFGSKTGAGSKQGQARYANAVYTYRPEFAGGYAEGTIPGDAKSVTFEFQTPYVIAATPASDKSWGVYEPGCKNGLVVEGKGDWPVSVSVDGGKTWQEGGKLAGKVDLTDAAKGHQHYLLRIGATAEQLKDSGLVMTTVCQCNRSILPHLIDGGTKVEYAASRSAIVSAGPEMAEAVTHIVEGGFGTKSVTLELATPRGEPAIEVYAAGHVASGNPPRADVKYAIDCSWDGGKTWQPIVHDWTIPRRGEEPPDFWSQSLCYGSAKIAESPAGSKVRVRFTNTGGRNYLRAEAHLRYRTAPTTGGEATFAWQDAQGRHTATEQLGSKDAATWTVPTGKNTQAKWVEIQAK